MRQGKSKKEEAAATVAAADEKACAERVAVEELVAIKLAEEKRRHPQSKPGNIKRCDNRAIKGLRLSSCYFLSSALLVIHRK